MTPAQWLTNYFGTYDMKMARMLDSFVKELAAGRIEFIDDGKRVFIKEDETTGAKYFKEKRT